ncbi:hypothetical protein D1007_41747 [Hordeum vulgare]|nr:hypothetical protein D1007_41747 [Hordeum vulgare]
MEASMVSACVEGRKSSGPTVPPPRRSGSLLTVRSGGSSYGSLYIGVSDERELDAPMELPVAEKLPTSKKSSDHVRLYFCVSRRRSDYDVSNPRFMYRRAERSLTVSALTQRLRSGSSPSCRSGLHIPPTSWRIGGQGGGFSPPTARNRCGEWGIAAAGG